jgi:hypothetical protein
LALPIAAEYAVKMIRATPTISFAEVAVPAVVHATEPLAYMAAGWVIEACSITHGLTRSPKWV